MGMTSIELELAHSAIRMNNAVADKFVNIDWEQRRYEIAKAVYPHVIELGRKKYREGKEKGLVPMVSEETYCAKKALCFTDALIEELKKCEL